MPKCQALIAREYKTKKADVNWPYCWPNGYNSPAVKTSFTGEVCGGDVTIRARAYDEGYHGGHSAELEINATCTRCRAPFYSTMNLLHEIWDGGRDIDLTFLLDMADVNSQPGD
jgi:hypothetical protein